MRAVAVGLTLQDVAYLRELWTNKTDAECAVARAHRHEDAELARQAQRNAEAFWTAYGVPLMLQAIDVAKRTLAAAGNEPDLRRAHAVVLTTDRDKPSDLVRQLRAIAERLESGE